MKKFDFPVVGIGASAGGLGAFKELLSAIPENTGMAFVLIQHLDPNHESSLSDILVKSTSMQVLEVKQNQEIKPNHVYVMPPTFDLLIKDDELIVTPRKVSENQHKPIDVFFKSLANEFRDNAIGIILSGTGNDGTSGIQAIKNKGGLTFAHAPQLAAYSQMPENAIASGHIDFVLAPTEMASALCCLKNSPFLTNEQIKPDQFSKVFEILRKCHHVDFSNYKEPTIKRRLYRRMVLNKTYSIDDYLKILNSNSSELKDLYNDLLINVTEFFRDTMAFEILRDEVFTSFLSKKKGDTIRIWVPGCSSGEEVYSIAISLVEFLEQKDSQLKIKIFASDISEKAINHARAGIYTKEQLKKIGKTRLNIFFHKVKNGYQINKKIRELCVFAIQNVTVDPPFSKLDLISCRNLLIYLNKNLQKRVIPLFHYALRPNGFLFLGVSETVNSFNELFLEVDRKNKIYSKKTNDHQLKFNYPLQHHKKEISMNNSKIHDIPPSENQVRRDIERYLVQQAVGVVINDKLEVIHSMGDVSAYLTLNSGAPSLNITKMAREFLALEIRSLVYRVKEKVSPAISELLEVKSAIGKKKFFLEVAPLMEKGKSPQSYLVLFKEALFYNEDYSLQNSTFVSEINGSMNENDLKFENHKLKQNLNYTKEKLLALKESLVVSLEAEELNREKLLTANEEVLSSNEELQSANEELQSTNEELETAKEELQSTNEELTAVNQELQNRNDELVVVNDDLVNLLNSVSIPVVMLDRLHRVRRFTPLAEKMFSIIPRDIGREITDIALKISVPDLKVRIDKAINTASVSQLEVTDVDGRWYSFHVYPYQTAANEIDGAVLVLIDINTLRASRDFFKSIVETVRNPLLVLDSEFRVFIANPSFYKSYQVTQEETEGNLFFELGDKHWNIPKLHELLIKILPEKSYINNFEVTHVFEKIGERTILLNARQIELPNRGASDLILLSIQDITDQRKKEKKLRDISEKLAEANKELEQFAYVASHDLQEPLRTISLYMELLMEKVTGKLSGNELEYIETVLNGIKKMKELIGNLLTLACASTEEVKNDSVDLLKLVSNITHILDPAIKESNASIQTENLPTLFINENLLGEVFINLISNAIKYRSELDPQIRISAKKELREWVISVQDNGIGIKPENQVEIFQIFRRLHSSDEYPGTGIGLAMCSRVVTKYGGKIWVESEFGKGSTFYFTLPCFDKN